MRVVELARELIESAASQGRDALYEHEAYALLAEAGLAVPQSVFVPAGTFPSPSSIEAIPGDRVVVKVICPEIPHKTEVGGVAVVEKSHRAVCEALENMVKALRRKVPAVCDRVAGFLVCEFIHCPRTLGCELFVGMRWTREFGYVMAAGLGGLDTEELARRFKPGHDVKIACAHLTDPRDFLRMFSTTFTYLKLSGRDRRRERLISDDELEKVFGFFLALAGAVRGGQNRLWISEFEVNPFYISNGRAVAVDALCTLQEIPAPQRLPVDQDKMERLLQPETIAIVGVSAREINIGRTILRNLLREGFEPSKMRVVRPDAETIDGVKCVDDVARLPWKADLMVVAVSASRVPEVMERITSCDAAHSVILIPGGMGETETGKEADERTRAILARCRREGREAPVVVGPNSLGIRSLPGGYDTLFIPETKLPPQQGSVRNVALVCQSGAFMITRMNRLPFLNPVFAISTGNQMDLSTVDFVEYLVQREGIDVVALYVEGFEPLDGLRLASLCRDLDPHKQVIVYKTGRTAEGAQAASSHTASISGDYEACVAILSEAGALVATSFDEFRAFIMLSSLLAHKEFSGRRLGTLSNAGFEAVGIADSLDCEAGFSLAPFSGRTRERIRLALREAGIERLTNVRNPLDLTPMASDSVHVKCLEAIIEDENVDAVVMGFVPLTPAMATLPPGVDPSGRDSVLNESSVARRVPEVFRRHSKPLVTVVDAGKLYDPLAEALIAGGVPCLRSADFAMRVFQRFIDVRLANLSRKA